MRGCCGRTAGWRGLAGSRQLAVGAAEHRVAEVVVCQRLVSEPAAEVLALTPASAASLMACRC